MTEISFADLDPLAVTEYAEFLAEKLREVDDEVSLFPGGAIYELVLKKAAAMHLVENVSLTRLRDYWNIQAISQAPESADDAVVDALLSNFRAARQPGVAATGLVEIILSQEHALLISAGTRLTAAGITFATAADYVVVRSEANKTSDTDRVLRSRPDGRYSFQVPVTAVTAGVAGNIAIGSSFVVSPRPIFFSDAVAASGFSNGTAAETNTSVLSRATQGMTAAVLSSRASAARLLQTLIPSTQAVSVTGMMDSELTRGRRSLLGFSGGGRADIYLRSQVTLDILRVTQTAVLLDAATHTYQLSLGRDAVAGAYEVVAVKSPAADDGTDLWADNLGITSVVWSQDLSNLLSPPDIMTSAEAAFSRYQSVVVEFTDESDAGTYNLYLRRLPSIDTAQAFCNDEAHSDPLADWLVKSPVPILVTVGLTIRRRATATVDPDRVAAGVAAAVNQQSFVSELSASTIIDAAAAALPTGAYVKMPISLYGRLIRPDRSEQHLRSANSLETPNEPTAGVSAKTVSFFCSPSDVDVSIEVI